MIRLPGLNGRPEVKTLYFGFGDNAPLMFEPEPWRKLRENGGAESKIQFCHIKRGGTLHSFHQTGTAHKTLQDSLSQWGARGLYALRAIPNDPLRRLATIGTCEEAIACAEIEPHPAHMLATTVFDELSISGSGWAWSHQLFSTDRLNMHDLSSRITDGRFHTEQR